MALGLGRLPRGSCLLNSSWLRAILKLAESSAEPSTTRVTMKTLRTFFIMPYKEKASSALVMADDVVAVAVAVVSGLLFPVFLS